MSCRAFQGRALRQLLRHGPSSEVAAAQSLAHVVPSSMDQHAGSQPSCSGTSMQRSPMHATLDSMQHASIRGFSSQAAGGASGSDGSTGNSQDKVVRMSLQEALSKLVDASIELLDQGNLDGAIAVMKEGVDTFAPNFPNSPELGELHNQLALLLLYSGNAEEAAQQAQAALDLTQGAFGPTSALTGHRLLRLGVARFAQGRLTEAAGQLQRAAENLRNGDPSAHEAQFYLGLGLLAGAGGAAQVRALDEQLVPALREMCKVFGGESMIVSLALSQHDRLTASAVGASAERVDPGLCEAMFKQHAKLLEMVGPNSESLGMCHYKQATFYYSNDILHDASAAVRKAAQIMRALFPEEHDLVVLCKHRLGMICAAAGDHRAAKQLLEASRAHYGRQEATAVLAKEAEFGLALAQFHSLSPAAADARTAALADVRSRIDALAAVIGVNHMLATGAMRYYAQAAALLQHGATRR